MPRLKDIGGSHAPEFARLYRAPKGDAVGMLLHPGVVEALGELKTPPNHKEMAAELKQAGLSLQPFCNNKDTFGFGGNASYWIKTTKDVTMQGIEMVLPTTSGPHDMGSVYNLICTLATITGVLELYQGKCWNDRHQGLTLSKVSYKVGDRYTFDLMVPTVLSNALKNEHWINWQDSVGLAMRQALNKIAPWWRHPDPFWLVKPQGWRGDLLFLNGPDGCRSDRWSSTMSTEARNPNAPLNAVLSLMLLCGLIELQRCAWPW